MERYYIVEDGRVTGSEETREEAIERVEARKKRQTHFMLRSDYYIIKGTEEFLPRNNAE